MYALSVKISISSIVQVVGLLVPRSLGITALLRGRQFLSNRFLGVFLVLFSLHISIFALRGREYLLRMPYLLLYLIRGREYFEIGIQRAFQGNPYWFVPLLDALKVVSGFAYAGAIVFLVRRHRERLKKWAEYRIHRRWIRTLIIGFIATWTVVLIMLVSVLILDLDPPVRTTQSGIETLAFVLFSAVIAVFSLKYPAILNPREVRQQIRKNLNLSAAAIEEIRRRLDEAVAEKFFTDSEPNLSLAAKMIDVHPNVLSFVINDSYDMGFKEYLSELRLREFLDRADTQALESTTILGLALDAGFPSKSTFNRVFKQKYDSTPRKYLKKNRSQFS